MTKRLTPEEKARRATRRALLKLPPRERFYATSGLTARTPAETAEYLAMIERQRVETEARGTRILAAYVADDARLQADISGRTDFSGYRLGAFIARHGLAGPVPMPHGTPLASRIAARTAGFQSVLAKPLRDKSVYVRRRKWWRFWEPKWESYDPEGPIK